MQRIIYLDSAKGICMLMIISQHVGAYIPIPYFYTAQTAAFFLLSGMFLSIKVPFKGYLTKNFKRILIPFLIFYLVSYALFYLGLFFVKDFRTMTEANGIQDCFLQKQYFNGPLWFLLALFGIKLLTYPLVKFIHRRPVQMLAAIGLGGAGFLFNTMEIDLPLAIDTAFSSVPLFYFGFITAGRHS